MKAHRVLARGSTVVAALLTMACGDDAAQDDTVPITLGAPISRTGTSAVGTWELALSLAASDAALGLRDANYPTKQRLDFKIKVADTVNMTTKTVSKGREMVDEGAKILMVGTSSDAVALSALAYDADAANDINVPIVCIACSSPALHNPVVELDDPILQAANRNEDGWVFGLAMASTYQSQVLWNIMLDMTPAGAAPGDIDGNGVVKISTVAQSDGFGTGFQNALEAVALDGNPNAIYEKLTFATTVNVNNEQFWSELVNELTDDETTDGQGVGVDDVMPDIVIEFAFPQFSLAIVKAYAAARKEQTFLHTHSMREMPVVLNAESALNGHQGTSYLPSDGRSGEMFDEHFRNAFSYPRESQWDSGAYDTGFLTALAVLIATKDMGDPAKVEGAAIRDAMKTLDDPAGEVIRPGQGQFAKAAKLIANGDAINYEGASGPCDFDQYGRALNRISHWRADDQEVTDIAVYDCVSHPSCPKQ